MRALVFTSPGVVEVLDMPAARQRHRLGGAVALVHVPRDLVLQLGRSRLLRPRRVAVDRAIRLGFRSVDADRPGAQRPPEPGGDALDGRVGGRGDHRA